MHVTYTTASCTMVTVKIKGTACGLYNIAPLSTRTLHKLQALLQSTYNLFIVISDTAVVSMTAKISKHLQHETGQPLTFSQKHTCRLLCSRPRRTHGSPLLQLLPTLLLAKGKTHDVMLAACHGLFFLYNTSDALKYDIKVYMI